MAAKKAENVQEMGKEMLNQSQDFAKESLSTLESMGQTYTNFMVEATQLSMNQALAMREGMFNAFAEGMKQAQDLSLKEQQVVLDNVEALSSQSKDIYEKMTNVLTPQK